MLTWVGQLLSANKLVVTVGARVNYYCAVGEQCLNSVALQRVVKVAAVCRSNIRDFLLIKVRTIFLVLALLWFLDPSLYV